MSLEQNTSPSTTPMPKGSSRITALIRLLLVRAANSAAGRLQAENHKIQLLELRLSALNPMSILEKGFAIPLKKGQKVTSASQLSVGDGITVILRDGKADCDVREVNIS